MIIGSEAATWTAFPRVLDRPFTWSNNDAVSREKNRELGKHKEDGRVMWRHDAYSQYKAEPISRHLGAVILVMENGMTGGMQCQQSCEMAHPPSKAAVR